jgi:integrase
MELTDGEIRKAKPDEKARKLFDGKGLFLLLTPTGGKWWRFKYRIGGREKLLSLGTYPEVTLAEARDRRDEARKLVAAKVDPSTERKAAKVAGTNTFSAVVAEWLQGQEGVVEEATLKRTRDRLKFVSRYIGTQPVADLKATDFLVPLEATQGRGRRDTAHRMRAECSRVMCFAVSTGRATRDPVPDLRDALKPIVSRNFAALTDPGAIGGLLRSIDTYSGQPVTEIALKIAPLVFVRPGELRGAEWVEFTIDGDEPLWRIPAARMKMRAPHLVPLSRQAVAVLRSLDAHSGGGRLLFPSLTDPKRPISENTLNAALRRMGYGKEEMTSHGFRAMASSCLNEKGIDPDVIELQLAHKERNKTRAAYNRATRLAERRAMMQTWADYLDELRAAKPRTGAAEAGTDGK